MLVLKNISRILTLRGGPVPRVGKSLDDTGILEGGAILVDGGVIRWVGATGDLPSDGGTDGHVIDGRGRALLALPGFVDSHTHPVFAATRAEEYDLRCRGASYQEIAAAGGGIRSSVRRLRQAGESELAAGARSRFPLFLAHGTTTIEAKSGYGLSLEDELKSLRALRSAAGRSPLEVVPTFLGAHDVPDEYRENRDEYVRLVIEEMIPAVASEGLARFCDVFCDTGYFTVEESRAILLAARAAGLGLRIHAEELGASGGALLAAELGARSADHLEWIDDRGIEALRSSGTIATLLPGTAFNLGLPGYPPARKLIDAGVPVALATDFNPGSCFTMNMQLILTIACSQMRMSPAEAIAAATVNAACAVDLQDSIGSLEEGKQADIVLMDVADHREIPYFFGVNHVVCTIKRGEVVYDRLEMR